MHSNLTRPNLLLIGIHQKFLNNGKLNFGDSLPKYNRYITKNSFVQPLSLIYKVMRIEYKNKEKIIETCGMVKTGKEKNLFAWEMKFNRTKLRPLVCYKKATKTTYIICQLPSTGSKRTLTLFTCLTENLS